MKSVKQNAAEGLMGRRAVLGGAVGIAAAGLVAHLDSPTRLAAQDATPVDAEGERATFVLVHCANAGAWIWKKVIPLLRAAGHDVYATTATGMGDRIHLADPNINLDVYISDVVNLMKYEELTNVTLVGWSYGGRIITGVAEQAADRISSMVYLDAAVPGDGQTGYDDYTDEGIGYEYRTGAEAGWPGFEVIHAGVEEGIRSLTKDPADVEWVLSKVTPQPMATHSQPVKLGNPEAAALPRIYIVCTEGRDIAEDPFIQQLQADPGWRVVELADNHFAPINAPELTAEALLSLV